MVALPPLRGSKGAGGNRSRLRALEADLGRIRPSPRPPVNADGFQGRPDALRPPRVDTTTIANGARPVRGGCGRRVDRHGLCGKAARQPTWRGGDLRVVNILGASECHLAVEVQRGSCFRPATRPRFGRCLRPSFARRATTRAHNMAGHYTGRPISAGPCLPPSSTGNARWCGLAARLKPGPLTHPPAARQINTGPSPGSPTLGPRHAAGLRGASAQPESGNPALSYVAEHCAVFGLPRPWTDLRHECRRAFARPPTVWTIWWSQQALWCLENGYAHRRLGPPRARGPPRRGLSVPIYFLHFRQFFQIEARPLSRLCRVTDGHSGSRNCEALGRNRGG